MRSLKQTCTMLPKEKMPKGCFSDDEICLLFASVLKRLESAA